MNIKESLAKYEITPNKALGQNFLIDKDAIMHIIKTADVNGKSVLEIGPGLGALTVELNKAADKLLAIELDKAMVDALGQTDFARPDEMMIMNADFLKVSDAKIAEYLTERFCVVANLPYYVTTPICMKLLQSGFNIESMTLMMQKEASARFLAGPGNKLYGALAVLANYFFDIKTVLELDPKSYYPQPEVDSVVLHLQSKNADTSIVCTLSRVLKVSFAMRRKTMNNNIMALGITKQQAADLLEKTGIDPMSRAEQLSIDDFIALAKRLHFDRKQ